jgi:polyribonucleotide nucleotidyltransferase
MEKNVEEKIDSYVEMYEKIYDKVSKNWSENELAVSDRIFQEISKDLRSEMISQMRKDEKVKHFNNTCNQENNVDESLATQKQRQTLYKFGIEKIPQGLSKDEASEILEELIDLSRHGNNDLLKQRIGTWNDKWNKR